MFYIILLLFHFLILFSGPEYNWTWWLSLVTRKWCVLFVLEWRVLQMSIWPSWLAMCKPQLISLFPCFVAHSFRRIRKYLTKMCFMCFPYSWSFKFSLCFSKFCCQMQSHLNLPYNLEYKLYILILCIYVYIDI